jgi:DNA-binding transcriptional MerR regulator
MNDSSPSSAEWLTAAECARRTAMTVRALRIYEDQGLIAPGRSSAGWRLYGREELVKLNTISLLKIVGFTLTQIRDVTRAGEQPTLRQVLELQLGAWRGTAGRPRSALSPSWSRRWGVWKRMDRCRSRNFAHSSGVLK